MVTESECLEALREAAERLGESPTKAQYEALGMRPASATIIRQLGGWNAAKEAAGLETYASTGSRVGPKPDHVELPADQTWEELSVDQRWHHRNVEWNAERTMRRRARLRTWVNDYKRERGCRRCNVSDHACLDLHHVDPADKEMAVGKMITHGYGRETLRLEMEKCEVLCANCHRAAHHTVPDDGTRRWVYEMKQSADGCASCDEDDPGRLEFHHVDGEKRDTIARMLADGRPLEIVREEVAKCELLCANCHRRTHFVPPLPSQRDDNHK